MKTSRNTKGKIRAKKNFSKYMQEKLAITVLVITLALFSLVIVLYNIIKNKQGDYTQIVLSQQRYDSRVLPYRRGDIMDRNGTYLATSEKVYNLIIDPNQIMQEEEKSLDTTASALSQNFGYNKEELVELIRKNKDKYYIRYERQLEFTQREEFEILQEQINNENKEKGVDGRVSGIWFEEEYKRVYPYSSLACNVIGFARADGMDGTGGIEQSYNSELIGTNGREYGYLNDESNLERVIKSASNGNNIVSTIDINIQNIVEKYIDKWENETGSNTSAVIVMDPNNGEILSMASSRKFDLNDPRNISAYYTEEEIAAMDENAQAEAWNKMWRNFCVSDTFEPGSPSKVFTVAAALEEGLASQGDHYFCDGWQEVGGWPIKCTAYKRGGHGDLTLEETLMVSCNDAMMQIAAKEGRERFGKYQRIFGLGGKTDIDLPGEADASNLIFKTDQMGPADLATNSFGQNYNCTMVQLAAAFSSAINGGSYYKPHVVKQVLNETGSVVKKIEPQIVRETVSSATSSFLRNALFRTVEEGTGSAAKVVGYEVGGKTGTAEKLPRALKNYLVSFIGFAPADDPQVVVYVVIDQPHLPSVEQARSSYASKICGEIMTEILPYLNVFPETPVTDDGENDVNLPSEEGISVGTASEAQPEETQPEETKIYDRDEYADPDNGESVGGLPMETDENGNAAETVTAETNETETSGESESTQ